MRPSTPRHTLAVGASALALVAGCFSTTTGNEGNLEFSYVSVDEISDFNKPLATGARLDLTVREAGTKKGVTLLTASSDDVSVARVEGLQGNTFVVHAQGPGSFQVSVRARVPSGAAVTDSVDMLVRDPEVLELRHHCTGDSEAAYLVDRDVLVGFDMSTSAGKQLIGYGVRPVDVEPADALTVSQTTKDSENLHFRTSATAQVVQLRSTIDDAALTMRLVEEADIDGAAFVGDKVADEVRVGITELHIIAPTVGGLKVCWAATEMQVTNGTPEICDLDTFQNTSGDDPGLVSLRGLSAGTCELTVTMPEANGGQGVTVPLSVAITGP